MVDLVDDAVEQYLLSITSGNIPRSVRVATLANFGGVSRGYMSTCLQLHRQAQQHGLTKYYLGCEGYGRYAAWRILRIPNSDPVSVQDGRKTHARYNSRDNFRKMMRDVATEIKPGLQNAPDDQLIDSATNMVQQSWDAAVQFLESVL